MEPAAARDPLTPRGTAPAPDGPSARARGEARAGLYVHVPFCAVRCRYCDFSSGRLSAAAVERYLATLEREAALRAPEARGLAFSSAFFGGGTPSALAPRHFTRLWAILADHFDLAPGAEITLEANPESVGPALLDAWAAAGVNRLSMGVQSFHSDELEGLGRIHGPERPAAALALARAHGFRRLSLDLMFGFPGHTLERWRRSLERALELDPGHLSAYCFIPEPGTPLGDAVLSGRAACPEAEEQADMYALLGSWLAAAGYGGYETSNFCRPGEEARHNLVYWLRRPYLGLGPSAHGLLGGVRYGNHYSLARWADDLERDRRPENEREPESDCSAASESVMLALRLATGWQPGDHPPELRRSTEQYYRAPFAHGLATGRLIARGEGVAIPAEHRFVADDIIAWIEARAEPLEIDSRARGSLPSWSCPNPPSPVA